jgi:hypothetical protein
MKSYPSIPRSTGQAFREFDAYVFDKLDGSNLRFEWSKKQGWHKFGTRHRLFDEKDLDFGTAIPIFKQNLSEVIEKQAKDNRWERVIAFCEFFGENSFSGIHYPEPKQLKLFDIDVYKKGLLYPKEFLKQFGDLDISVKFLGCHKWNRSFVEKVRINEIEGITFEGAVGKAVDGREIIMAKAKTQAWIDAVKAHYGLEADLILNS